MIGWPIRPAPIIPTTRIAGSAGSAPRGAGSAPPGSCVGAEPGLRGEDNALLRVDVDEDGAADRRPQRRMLAREQRTRAERDAEVDRLAEKHLLLHRRAPDVVPGRAALDQADVLGPDGDRHAVPCAERPWGFHRHLTD